MSTVHFFKHRRVLVTGGTGFVGSHLVQALVGLGARVVVVSRSTDPYGYFASQQLERNVIQVHGDVKHAQQMADVVSKYEISFIFHLAAQPLVTTALVNPRETLETNIMGTVNVLEAARLSPWVEGIIVASSDKAYGKLKGPYKEDDPLHGDHPYEVSKSSADLIAQTYATTYSLPVVVTRFGNIYGEGDTNPSRVIPGILLSLLSNEPFQIRSNGMFQRAYLCVGDVVNGYLQLAEKTSEYRGEAFNFGSDEIYSVLELIRVFEQTMGIQVPYEILNTAVNEIPSQSLSSEKVKERLLWTPKIRLASTISTMYEWYKNYVQKMSVFDPPTVSPRVFTAKNENTGSASGSTIFSVS